jgi:hypothetical protein
VPTFAVSLEEPHEEDHGCCSCDRCVEAASFTAAQQHVNDSRPSPADSTSSSIPPWKYNEAASQWEYKIPGLIACPETVDLEQETVGDQRQRVKVEGEGGLHRDGDKPRLADMIPPELLLEAGKIWAENNRPRPGYPEGKYPDLAGGIPNFKAGIRTTKYLDSIFRHLLALIAGEDTDADSERDAAGHMLCDLAMFWWTRQHRPDLDDRNAMPPESQ